MSPVVESVASDAVRDRAFARLCARRKAFPAQCDIWSFQDWSLTSLQQRLLKTGGRLIRHARYFSLQLAESYLTRSLFRQILQRIDRLGWHPT